MPKTKRLRMFAGPNGSGKSTLFGMVSKVVSPTLFINSDNIEKSLSEYGFFDLKLYNLNATQDDFERFCKSKEAQSLIVKSEKTGHKIDAFIKENIVVDKSNNLHSYEASLLSSFIRTLLYKKGESFSFETVMSHISKLDEIESAKKMGYKTYLYFVCLDYPGTNLSRIQNRIEMGGHDVAFEKVVSRYSKTLENLTPAIHLADRTYLFDNSVSMQLIAESHQGELIIHSSEKELPGWFVENVINKL